MFNAKLPHVPGKPSYIPIRDVITFFSDYHNATLQCKEQYGEIFRTNIFGIENVNLLGKDAAHFVLVKHAKDFDSQKSWEVVLKDLFPNGLMLMDGDRHKYHRSIVSEAFKKVPMEGYLEMMKGNVTNFLSNLNDPNPKMFPTFKELTLDVALKVFFGLDQSDQLSDINEAIINIVKASAAIQINLPFTTFGKGLKARKYLEELFRELIHEKRENPGKDLFSILTQSTNEEGESLNDEAIIDHLIFILMAAHDTTASTLTSLTYFLAKDLAWQQKLRKEAQQFYRQVGDNFEVKDLRALVLTNNALKETLRMYPPLVSIARVSNKEVTYRGYTFPKDTYVTVYIEHNHNHAEVWTNPKVFDPNRFDRIRKEHQQCPYTYAPFGAGIHHCVGFAFAEMQIKLVISQLLIHFEWTVPENYLIPMKPVPLQEPTDGLPIYLKKI